MFRCSINDALFEDLRGDYHHFFRTGYLRNLLRFKHQCMNKIITQPTTNLDRNSHLALKLDVEMRWLSEVIRNDVRENKRDLSGLLTTFAEKWIKLQSVFSHELFLEGIPFETFCNVQ